MDVQGAIVEHLSGLTLPEFMRTRIFEPLGMVDTAFSHPAGKGSAPPRRLSLVAAPAKLLGRRTSWARSMPSRLAWPTAATKISTLSDYAKFAQMMLNGGEFGGKRIVSAAALKQRRRLSPKRCWNALRRQR